MFHIGSNNASSFAKRIEKKQTRVTAQKRDINKLIESVGVFETTPAAKQAKLHKDEELLLASNIESLYQDPIKEVTSSNNDLVLSNSSTCSILHLNYSGYFMQGKGKTIQAKPSEFQWLYWNPQLSDFPSTKYYVFGKEVNGSMRYMTCEKHSKVVGFLSESEIDFESTDQDPRLFYWKGNYLVSAASTTNKLFVCLNSNTGNVELYRESFEDEWHLS